jgi:hypothetical protein
MRNAILQIQPEFGSPPHLVQAELCASGRRVWQNRKQVWPYVALPYSLPKHTERAPYLAGDQVASLMRPSNTQRVQMHEGA